MLKPFALRLARLLFAGMDDACASSRPSNPSRPNDWSGVPSDAKRTVSRLANNADALGGHAKLNCRLRNPGRVCD
jgi:hypothetical protein